VSDHELGAIVSTHRVRLFGGAAGALMLWLATSVFLAALLSFDNATGMVAALAIVFASLALWSTMGVLRDLVTQVVVHEHAIVVTRSAEPIAIVRRASIVRAVEGSSSLYLTSRDRTTRAVPANVTDRDELCRHVGLRAPTLPQARVIG
jgi:hypothetical protein